MVLQVEFEHLAEEAKRHGVKPWVYLTKQGVKVIATVGDPANRLVIQSETSIPLSDAHAEATRQGLLVAQGRWIPDPLAGELQIEESMWVTSVAYKSGEDKPGLWVHAYRGQPSMGDVLKDFYDEMSAEVGASDVPLETFLSNADPNVVIIGPDEMEAFVRQTKDC